ncbi:MAG: hypothetical protein ACT4OL_03530 [Nitrospiraceae bacterium]
MMLQAVYSTIIPQLPAGRMRKPTQIIVDRALLLYVLHLTEPYGLLSDVKLQQLCFLCELQTFGKGYKGFHFEFFRFAYGAFSKDLDNDLTSLRRKERVENFTLSDQAKAEVIPLLLKGIEGVETNEKVKEIIDAVVTMYGPQDGGEITKSVEAVELSIPQQPGFKIPLRYRLSHHAPRSPSDRGAGRIHSCAGDTGEAECRDGL